jgi:hypothetical protein
MQSVNHILVKLNKTFIDEIITENGLKLYLDPSYRPEWNCNVTGEIASLPTSVKPEHREMMAKLYVGDEVAFSYWVVIDRSWGSDGEHFYRIDEKQTDYHRVYMNGKGDKITVIAYEGKITIRWACVLNDKDGELIDGRSNASESEIERWLAQFTFGGVQTTKFNNLIEIDGVDYWKVSPEFLFAKKDKKGITMFNNKLLCNPIDIDLTQRVKITKGIHLPDGSVQGRYFDRARVVSGGGDMGLIAGDVVATQPKYMEAYQLWDREYFLINKRNVFGVWKN